MASYCDVVLEEKAVVCHLPITSPTGKVRIKRNRMPLAVRQNIIEPEDEVEWQVSYHRGKIRDSTIAELVELGLMLKLGLEAKLITPDEFQRILEQACNQQEFFDTHGIKLVHTHNKFLNEYEMWEEKVPIIRKTFKDGLHADAILGHRQVAVGYQPMLFIYIPVKNLSGSSTGQRLVGRPASTKEIVFWKPSTEVTIGLVRMFAVLSKPHNRDMQLVLRHILDHAESSG